MEDQGKRQEKEVELLKEKNEHKKRVLCHYSDRWGATQDRADALWRQLKKIRDFVEFSPLGGTEATTIVLETDALLAERETYSEAAPSAPSTPKERVEGAGFVHVAKCLICGHEWGIGDTLGPCPAHEGYGQRVDVTCVERPIAASTPEAAALSEEREINEAYRRGVLAASMAMSAVLRKKITAWETMPVGELVRDVLSFASAPPSSEQGEPTTFNKWWRDKGPELDGIFERNGLHEAVRLFSQAAFNAGRFASSGELGNREAAEHG